MKFNLLTSLLALASVGSALPQAGLPPVPAGSVRLRLTTNTGGTLYLTVPTTGNGRLDDAAGTRYGERGIQAKYRITNVAVAAVAPNIRARYWQCELVGQGAYDVLRVEDPSAEIGAAGVVNAIRCYLKYYEIFD